MDRSKVTQQLVKDNVLFEHAGRYFSSDNFKETGLSKFDTIRNMTSSEHGVIVMGVAKSGSHLALSILDALGVDRAEELGVPGGVTPFPFEYQRTHEVYHRMEKMMAEAKRPIMLPHCHLTPELFINNFKGKIVYISRDVRAVAASAYPFLNKLPQMKPLLTPYERSDKCFTDIILYAGTYHYPTQELRNSWRLRSVNDKRRVSHVWCP